MQEKAQIINADYNKALNSLEESKFDLIFIDPPYKLDLAVDAISKIMLLNLLEDDGIIVLETDNKERELEKLKNINVNVYDLRKYGRVTLIFLNRKG